MSRCCVKGLVCLKQTTYHKKQQCNFTPGKKNLVLQYLFKFKISSAAVCPTRSLAPRAGFVLVLSKQTKNSSQLKSNVEAFWILHQRSKACGAFCWLLKCYCIVCLRLSLKPGSGRVTKRDSTVHFTSYIGLTSTHFETEPCYFGKGTCGITGCFGRTKPNRRHREELWNVSPQRCCSRLHTLNGWTREEKRGRRLFLIM